MKKISIKVFTRWSDEDEIMERLAPFYSDKRMWCNELQEGFEYLGYFKSPEGINHIILNVPENLDEAKFNFHFDGPVNGTLQPHLIYEND